MHHMASSRCLPMEWLMYHVVARKSEHKLFLNSNSMTTDLQDDEVQALADEDAGSKQLLSAARDVIARLLVSAPKRRKDDASRGSLGRIARPQPPRRLPVGWMLAARPSIA